MGAKVKIALTMTTPIIEPAYQAALDYLYSFVDYSLTRQLQYSQEAFNLDRMTRLMHLLGDPQKTYPIVHVAGTKGKGSTAAMIESVCQTAGYRTGFYISPHLHDFSERIQVNRIHITHSDLVALLDEIKPAIAQVERITTFEISTALGFLYFARQKVDIAVVEVGLGGRLDATNIITPIVSVITSLSMDHMNILGDTLSKIAREKAGIIKPGVPVVLSSQKIEASDVVVDVAQECGSKLVQVGNDFLFKTVEHSLDGQSFQIWQADEQEKMDAFIAGDEQDWQPVTIRIPLLGRHQVQNAATAYAVIQVIRDSGFEISNSAILSGFSSVNWEGRFEIISQQPLVILDSAHNRDSAAKLRTALDDYLPGKPVILVFGASEDKDVRGMLTELQPNLKLVVATQSEHPRAMSAGEIADMCRNLDIAAVPIVSVTDAVAFAESKVQDHQVIVVAGSIFLAAAGKEIWQATHPQQGGN